MAKIFIDVGGHLGETVEAVIDPKYGFDVIYSFEPVSSCCERIRQIRDSRVRVMTVGLSNRDFEASIHNPGSLGASLYEDAPDAQGKSEKCRFIEAARFFREHIKQSDRVYLKLNCEGSEVDVIENLIINDEWSKVTNAMIDFDARKIPSQRLRVESVTNLLVKTGMDNYQFPEDYMYGTGSHFGGIKNWLNKTGAIDFGIRSRLMSLIFHSKNVVGRKHLGFYKLKILRHTPVFLVNYYYNKMKRNVR
ncbi:MAG TPA: FkbM family methyltransferase [Pyrinomonadaceae bacterium]